MSLVTSFPLPIPTEHPPFFLALPSAIMTKEPRTTVRAVNFTLSQLSLTFFVFRSRNLLGKRKQW